MQATDCSPAHPIQAAVAKMIGVSNRIPFKRNGHRRGGEEKQERHRKSFESLSGGARESKRRTDLFLSLLVDKLAVKETEESRDL